MSVEVAGTAQGNTGLWGTVGTKEVAAKVMAVYARLRRGGRIVFQTGDHRPPHFHAEFGEDEATFYVDTGELKEGHLPPQDLRVVNRWYRRDPDATAERLMEAWREYA